MTAWKTPPEIKIYEALGAVADGRVELTGNEARVRSSEGTKFYTVLFDPDINAIMTNDNGSYWQGYLGYPAIAFLMVKGLLHYTLEVAEALKGIEWKKINTRNKNDFKKTKEEVLALADSRRVTRDTVEAEVNRLAQDMGQLNLQKLGKRLKPPRG